jgi:hypothetical protein
MSPKFLSKKAALAAVFAGLTVAAVESSQAMPQAPQIEVHQSIISTALTGITVPADLTITPSAEQPSVMAWHSSHSSHSSHASHSSHYSSRY